MDSVAFSDLESGVQTFLQDELERPEHYQRIISENDGEVPRTLWVEYERYKGMVDQICGISAGGEWGNESYVNAMNYVTGVMGI
tara:strand:- start:3968 stop:4219 length:252 start_codon:yes stop_codon:yes gene_type:complete